MPQPNPPSTGHVLVNKTTNATNETGGNLLSGHGEAKQKPKAKVSKNQEMLLNQEQRMRMESMAYLPRQSVYHIEPSRKKKMV